MNKNNFTDIVNITEKELISYIKVNDINNLGDFYDERIDKNIIFYPIDIQLAKTISFFTQNKSIKIIEVGGGICQLSILLYKLGYQNIYPNEINDTRIEFIKNFCNELNIPIKTNYLFKDFFNIDINQFDLLITQNICWKRNNNEERYKEFLFYKNYIYNGGLIIYGYLCDTDFIDNEFKKCRDIEFYYSPKYEIKFVYLKNKFDFKNLNSCLFYDTISFTNIIDNIININTENILKLEFKNDILYSAGFFIPYFYILPNIEEKIHKCKLSFDIKLETSNENSKLKIFTGIKWAVLDSHLTNEFQTIEFIDDFNFFKPSTYRIGFVNIENNILYIKKISLILKDQ